MDNDKSIIPIGRIEGVVHIIRNHKVILDQDLAVLYGVETGQLNRAVKRNKKRFPEEFAFQLSKDEWNSLRCQFGISNSNTGRGGRRYMPFVFTEHGVAMAANLLKNDRAIEVSIEIVRTFIRLREFLTSHKELAKEFQEIKEFVLKNSSKNNREFQRVWRTIEKLTKKPKKQRQIGFNLN